MQRTSILEDLEDENLNLTPLIDCVFLLLIFFMVTTVFKQPYSLRVELPQARQATIVEEKKLVASIDKVWCHGAQPPASEYGKSSNGARPRERDDP